MASESKFKNGSEQYDFVKRDLEEIFSYQIGPLLLSPLSLAYTVLARFKKMLLIKVK